MAEVKLTNDAKYPVYIESKGKTYSIAPGEVKFFTKRVADLFTKKFDEEVRVADGWGLDSDDTLKDERVWVANMTGNPDAPKTVKVQILSKINKNFYETKEIENPLAEAKVVRRKWVPGEIQSRTAEDGSYDPVFGPVEWIEIGPYERKPFDRKIWNWMRQRDGMNVQHERGKIGMSRPPSDFEPDMSWDYEDMQLYAYLVDPKKFKGAEFVGHSPQQLKEMYPDKDDYEDALLSEKEVLYKRLFFCIVSPTAKLPTRNEFELYRTKKGALTERRKGPMPKQSQVEAAQ